MRRRSLVVGATMLFGLVAPACGEEPTTGAAPHGSDRVAAQGFAVGWLPDGFGSPNRVEGHRAATLSDDSAEYSEPFLVLAPNGWSGDPADVILVSLTDGSMAEGGLEQNLWPADGIGPSSTVVEGSETWTYPLQHEAGTDVVRRVEGERGVRVRSGNASEPVLHRIAANATISARDVAVPDPPPGWEQISHVDAEQVANLSLGTGNLGAGVEPASGARS